MFESFEDFMNEKMVSPKRGHNYFIVTKPVEIAYIAGHYGMGMEVPGVLIKNKPGYFQGKKGAYIIDYFGAVYYVDMKAKLAMPIMDMASQQQLHNAIKPVDKAPEHADWKGFLFQESVEVNEKYDGKMSDFRYEFPQVFSDVTGNPEKAIKKMAKAGKNAYEVRTSTYMSKEEMEEVGKAMGLELTDYQKYSSVAISVYESTVNEGKIQLKRKYTENYPAITAGKSAKIRNKMLEAIADGKLTQEEFKEILREMSVDSGRWVRRNQKYFNVSEDGISLSKFGKRALKQITVNENMDNFIFESFGEFINANNAETINEGTHGQVGIIDKKGNIQSVYTHYDSYPEHVLPILKRYYKNANAVKDLVASGDNPGIDAPQKMDFYNDGKEPMSGNAKDIKGYIDMAKGEAGAEYVYLYDERDKTWYMANAYQQDDLVPIDQYNESNTLFEATVEMDAMDPDNKDFVKFLKKNKVNIISKEEGPNGHPVIVMQGKRKDLETVLADEELGFADPDLAEYIEESIVNEAFKSSKLRNLMNMDHGHTSYGKKIHGLAQAFYSLTKAKLDKIEDEQLIDFSDPKQAAKEFKRNDDVVVFYIADNEKTNPYADRSAFNDLIRPGIIGVSRGSEFLGANYEGRGKRLGKNKAKVEYGMHYSKENAIGGNKKYRGYEASGLYTVKRVSELADRAIAINLALIKDTKLDARQKVADRAAAKEGALAFQSAEEFKKAQKKRYQEILATKASKLPLDKIVETSIETLTKHIADAMKRGEKTKYGEIKIGEDKKGREIKLTDASNIMSSILGDYERYVRYLSEAEKEKDSGYSSGYYEREAKNYAKNITDRAKKVKNMNYAW